LDELVHRKPPVTRDFLGNVRRKMVHKWNNEDTGRFMHSIIPSVALKPWLDDCKAKKNLAK
jgi:hypothetical protein